MALLDRIGKADRGGGPMYNTFDRIRVEKVPREFAFFADGYVCAFAESKIDGVS